MVVQHQISSMSASIEGAKAFFAMFCFVSTKPLYSVLWSKQVLNGDQINELLNYLDDAGAIRLSLNWFAWGAQWSSQDEIG